MSKTLEQGMKDFFSATKKRSCQDIGHMVVEYVLEAGHNNWEGYGHVDQAAIGRLLIDLATYMDAAGEVSQVAVFTGSQYLTTDR